MADENGGKLKNRCVFFCDEYDTLPKIESAEMMFSASRSRRLQIVPLIQSFSQLEKNYSKEGAEIIIDNNQLTIFGGFAPQSTSVETLSKALGSRTVMSGSVSRSKNDPSESLQMIERPLMTPDELKSMPKRQFVIMKTGFYPMKVRLKLFFKWGFGLTKSIPTACPIRATAGWNMRRRKRLWTELWRSIARISCTRPCRPRLYGGENRWAGLSIYTRRSCRTGPSWYTSTFTTGWTRRCRLGLA